MTHDEPKIGRSFDHT